MRISVCVCVWMCLFYYTIEMQTHDEFQLNGNGKNKRYFSFAKIRRIRTKAVHTHTHTYFRTYSSFTLLCANIDYSTTCRLCDANFTCLFRSVYSSQAQHLFCELLCERIRWTFFLLSLSLFPLLPLFFTPSLSRTLSLSFTLSLTHFFFFFILLLLSHFVCLRERVSHYFPLFAALRAQ